MSEKETNGEPHDSEEIDLSEDEETVEVHGFDVLASQENEVKEIFKKHPNLISNFTFKNQQLKNEFMDVFLHLITTLCRPISELSVEDLNNAENTLFDLTKAGLKVEWLREKLDEFYLKKEKQTGSGARIKELEEQVKKRKRTLSDLESDLKKEKAAALAAKAPLGFNDVV